jgi:hypothetical protein
MNRLFVILCAAILAGCASQPAQPGSEYAACTLPVTRDAGLGVRVPACAAWEFGPSKRQREEFDRRAAARR